MKPLIPLPHCETCGKPCKQRWRSKGKPTRFCSKDCIPRQLRVEAGRRGRLEWIRDHRLRRFREHLKRLQALPKITAPELVAVFAAIEQHAWDLGYATCESKWKARDRREQKGAAA